MSEINSKKVFYSTNMFVRPMNGELKDTTAVIDGYVEKCTVREVTTASGTKKVANVELTATIPDSKVKFNFGEDFVRADHRVRFRVAFWNGLAETVEKANYQQGTILMVAIKDMKLGSWQMQNGNTAYYVEGTAGDYPKIVRFPKTGDAQPIAAEPSSTEPPAQNTNDLFEDDLSFLDGPLDGDERF